MVQVARYCPICKSSAGIPVTQSQGKIEGRRVAHMKTAKEEVRELLEQLPEDSSLEDIQYHIYVRQKVQTGLDAFQKGKVIPQDEIEKRMARWLAK
jgi:predicted Zn-ribbon and HTH transcriptional regulator